MNMEFSVLASGSSGNASLVRMLGFGLLVDLGLGPRQLERRLREVGAGWEAVQAVLLSHTHGDHWHEKSLQWLVKRRIPLYCHAGHQDELTRNSPAFAQLRAGQLVRIYACTETVALAAGIRFRALPLSHDGGITCGFRIDGPAGALGYAADLGTWQPELAQALANVDILAVEFNHDVLMERQSCRSPQLIARVLGDAGHLSNDQAADLVAEVLRLSEPGRVRHLVQLHLSRQCNRPSLASRAARRVIVNLRVRLDVHTASQDRPGPIVRLGKIAGRPFSRNVVKVLRPVEHCQPLLPGWDD